ncbi:MAG: hypothetical protein KatS3mg082_1811 [Nitrospiraceae bacterium]|nr:MAG: hypothetical protein KatS3mg082_1811 [Nitrospiraceae bacterium]
MTWIYASQPLRVTWDRAGGDWIDAKGQLHGSEPFAAVTLRQYGVQTASWNATEAVRAILRGEADGFLLRGTGGWAHFASNENTSHPGPRLALLLKDGTTKELTPVLDTWLASSSANPLAGREDLQSPILLVFDLSGIMELERATLWLTSYNQGSLPATYELCTACACRKSWTTQRVSST